MGPTADKYTQIEAVPLISAQGITQIYDRSPVLEEVSLTVERGQVVGLIGPNGSGKTTLLRALYGSITPTAGTVLIDGKNLKEISPKQLARRIGVVVQEPPSDLMLSVTDTVLLGRTPHLGAFERASRHDDELAAEALDRVGLLHLAHREFTLLSGGEKQRVLIARALAQEAECLLLDEPTNHLDISYQHQVLHLVRELGLTAVVVLHDLNLAARYCDSILLLSQGRLAAEGTPEKVFMPTTVDMVYTISSERVTADDGVPQLLFRPKRTSKYLPQYPAERKEGQ